jgi:hypothetical protein
MEISMADEKPKPNFVLVTESDTRPVPAAPRATTLDRLRAQSVSMRPRLVFGFDATVSRRDAWDTARQVTDALLLALPNELDVALAVHGGSKLHTFSAFTADARTLRDLAAGIDCIAGETRMLPILAESLKHPAVRVVVYTGDVFEENPEEGRKLADMMAARGIKLVVLHDGSHDEARRFADVFHDLTRRTGGCVLPFDANAPDKLRDLLAALAVFAVGGTTLLRKKRNELPGAPLLLAHLDKGGRN